MNVNAAISRPEQPVSVHRFSFWGALGRTCLFLFCGVLAAAIGLGCLCGCFVVVGDSALQAALWGVFALCGFISAPALVYEAIRVLIQTPSVIAVYRSGLRWEKGGKETAATWAEVTRVERQVTVFIRAGRERRSDTTTIDFASGKRFRIWGETLSDYSTFADSVKQFHDYARLGKTVPEGRGQPQRTKLIRCWHCGNEFEVTLTGLPMHVCCPRCQSGLGAVLP